MEEKVYSGIYPEANDNIEKFFTKEEQNIIKYWKSEWYITNARSLTIGKSTYRYLLAKPTPSVEEAININREIIIVFSNYKTFEPRTLEAFEKIIKEFTEQRIEKICYVLISAHDNIEQALSECLTNQENQIIVPFSYSSFAENKSNPQFIKNQFKKHFYSRDLFDYSEPLKKDTFFFGRDKIVTEIIEKHKSGLNYGVFGLRKTGKTSIIYDVKRKSQIHEFTSIIIDCQDPSFNMRRWNKALYYVIKKMKTEVFDINIEISENEFTDENSSAKFQNYLQEYYRITNKKILIMFDEIENITFLKSGVEHWRNGLDFVYFWQSIRSAYQDLNSCFTFCIFGTNAKCIEDSTIKGVDNPIYNMFKSKYISGFDYQQTREMVRKLGRIMGITFDEGVYTRLQEDYGGHPFLIRRICSQISQMNPDRPVKINREIYNQAKEKFNSQNEYFEMILQVLKQFYDEEYEMLCFLSIEDWDNFNYFINEDSTMINHLIGYGLIHDKENNYDFKIDAIKEYILRIENKHKILKSPSEKWEHLCKERNKIELELRKMVRSIIKFAHKNESQAKSYVIKKIYSNKEKFLKYSYNDLFDPKICNIYLKNLTDLIKADWDYFSDYFDNQDVFLGNMQILNSQGRFDTHAKIPDDAEMNIVDNSITYLNKCIEKYNTSLQ